MVLEANTDISILFINNKSNKSADINLTDTFNINNTNVSFKEFLRKSVVQLVVIYRLISDKMIHGSGSFIDPTLVIDQTELAWNQQLYRLLLT